MIWGGHELQEVAKDRRTLGLGPMFQIWGVVGGGCRRRIIRSLCYTMETVRFVLRTDSTPGKSIDAQSIPQMS